MRKGENEPIIVCPSCEGEDMHIDAVYKDGKKHVLIYFRCNDCGYELELGRKLL